MRFTSSVLGPHFEQVCRYWTRYIAPAGWLAAEPSHVGAGTINDPSNRTTHQLDVVAFGADSNRSRLLAIGEVKWGETMTLTHLDRLRHIQGLLAAQNRYGASSAKLLCYSAAGFSDDLRAAADRDPGIGLVGSADLYH